METVYWRTKPAANSLGISSAPLRSWSVSVMPIPARTQPTKKINPPSPSNYKMMNTERPSMVRVRPRICQFLCAQRNDDGFQRARTHADPTHKGKANDSTSPARTMISRRLRSLSPSVPLSARGLLAARAEANSRFAAAAIVDLLLHLSKPRSSTSSGLHGPLPHGRVKRAMRRRESRTVGSV